MKNSLFDLEDRVIVVTGAAGVLAGGTARYLLEQGAKVVMLDLKQEVVDQIVADAKATISPKVSGYACNVLDRAMIESVYEKVMAEHGRVDALVNGAGGNMAGAMVNPDQTIVFVKAMVQQKKGAIVNFSSMAAKQAISRGIGYSNAKGAIDNLTRWLAMEFGMKFGEGLRVNAIAPGFFLGKQNRALLVNEDGSYTPRGKQVVAKTPMGRFGDQSEVYGCIHYLLSDAASFVTGAIIPVDGGFSSFSGI